MNNPTPQSPDQLHQPPTTGDIERQTRPYRWCWWLADPMLLAISSLLAASILDRWPDGIAWLIIISMSVLRIALFWRLQLYRAILRYGGLDTVYATVIGCGVGTMIALSISVFLLLDKAAGLGRQFWVLEGLLAIMLIGGSRLLGRVFLEQYLGKTASGDLAVKRVLIYGAGSLGELACRDLMRAPGYQPAAFLDDDPSMHKSIIHGKKVYGGLNQLDKAIVESKSKLIVVAISDLSPEKSRDIFRAGMKRGIHVLLAKGVGNAFDNGSSNQLDLRDMALEDLLRRPSRNLDDRPVREMLSGRCVLVTGAGGSIGSDICRQCAQMGIRELHILDHSEFALFTILGELQKAFPKLHITPHLVSLCDRSAIESVLAISKPHLVLHAAAYKHVPLVETNPLPGLRNNILGFSNLLHAAEQHQVESLILISTDKAVRPTNVMGASKRVCELLMQAHANLPNASMRCCAVRFGNVLGSSGSVVPHFIAQIQSGGPVTVTDPNITRYFMLIPEAVSLVLQAAARSTSAAEIFILNMGEPVRIDDLARQLIFMHGKQPDSEIPIAYSGLRPGEKLYEELLIDESDSHTDIPDITVAAPNATDPHWVDKEVAKIISACAAGNATEAAESLQRLVPEWAISSTIAQATGLPSATNKIVRIDAQQRKSSDHKHAR